MGVVIPSDRSQERGDINICPDNGIQDPLQPEIGDTFEAIFERINPCDADGAGRSEPFTGKETKERCLTGAVGYVVALGPGKRTERGRLGGEWIRISY